jgi:hypothetical protein
LKSSCVKLTVATGFPEFSSLLRVNAVTRIGNKMTPEKSLGCAAWVMVALFMAVLLCGLLGVTI